MKQGLRSPTVVTRLIGAFLSVLLTLQVVISFVPVAVQTGPYQISYVICGHDGLETITVNLSDGSVEQEPSTTQSKCPFCVLGAALQTAGFCPDAAPVTYARVAYGRLSDLAPVRQVQDPIRAIRAPPTVL